MSLTPSSRPALGIGLALQCLLLLGVMPIIANGRPMESGALVFALWLSVWQLLFSLPPFVREWRTGERGLFSDSLQPLRKRRLIAVTLLTGALFGLSTWLYVLAFEKAGAVNAAIALQAYPLFAAGLEAVFLGRRKSWGELGFMLLVLAALYYLATKGTWRLEGLSFWFLLALAVPAIWSIAHIIIREALVNTPITPHQVTVSRLIVSVTLLFPLTLAIEGSSSVSSSAFNGTLQLFAIAMGLAYYLELIIWFNAVRHIDVSVASSITVPAPAITIALAAFLLGETVTGPQLLALTAVFLGLFGLIIAGLRNRGRQNGPALAGSEA
ncbi:DMT family transporter [Rhodopseudomonas palustris]|nr:DMT family transporter [Rhodopseudomonas palustris]